MFGALSDSPASHTIMKAGMKNTSSSHPPWQQAKKGFALERWFQEIDLFMERGH